MENVKYTILFLLSGYFININHFQREKCIFLKLITDNRKRTGTKVDIQKSHYIIKIEMYSL